MGMSKKCYSFLRCLLVFLNIVLLMVGLAGLTVGVVGTWSWQTDGAGVGESGEERTATAAALVGMAAWGGALAAGAATGAAGAARGGGGGGGGALLAASFAALALCAAAEAAAAWWAAAHVPRLERALRLRLRHTMLHHYGHLQSATQLVDIIQEELDCCGTEGPRDWQTSEWSRALASPPAPAPGASSSPGPAPTPASLAAAVAPALDLSISAAPEYYVVPPSCCLSPQTEACGAGSGARVPWSGDGGAGGVGGVGVRTEPCGARVVSALGKSARVPLAAAAALGVAHALALLLTLLLCMRARPASYRYKS